MSGKRAIFAGGAKPIAPYSPAILAGNTLYIAGQIGTLADGTLAPTLREQTVIVMNKIKALLEAADMTMENLVDCTVLLAYDMGGYKEMNEVYGSYFTEAPPARAAFAVAELPLKALIEIKAVAYKQ